MQKTQTMLTYVPMCEKIRVEIRERRFSKSPLKKSVSEVKFPIGLANVRFSIIDQSKGSVLILFLRQN